MNPGWTGNDAANMFDGTSGVLKPGEEITLQLTALVNLDELTPTSHWRKQTRPAATTQLPDSPATKEPSAIFPILAPTQLEPIRKLMATREDSTIQR